MATQTTTLPGWADGFDQEKVIKAAESNILPKAALPEVGSVITVVFDTDPVLFEHEKLPNGKAWQSEVFVDGMKMSLIVPDSLRFSLLTQIHKLNINSVKGKTVKVSAVIADTKFQKGAKLYNAQIIED